MILHRFSPMFRSPFSGPGPAFQYQEGDRGFVPARDDCTSIVGASISGSSGSEGERQHSVAWQESSSAVEVGSPENSHLRCHYHICSSIYEPPTELSPKKDGPEETVVKTASALITQPVLCLQAQELDSRPCAVDEWYAVWCHEYAYKAEMSDMNNMLSQEVGRAGGIFNRKKDPKAFNECWLNVESSNAPYVLIVSWRHAKPCFLFLEQELSKGQVQKMPQAIYVVAQTKNACRASSLASEYCWNITVDKEMTRDQAKAWLRCLPMGTVVSQSADQRH